MGAFVVVALGLWCFTGVFGDEDIQANTLDCSQHLQATGNGPISCTRIYFPVCGTDGNTYANECELCRHNQEKNKLVGKKHVGECPKMDCSEFRQAKGLMLCSKMAKPVCGTDDNTYVSKCDLCRQNLESNKNVAVKYGGQCIQIQDYCKNFSPNALMCPLNYMPHCGSDGKNYSNQCDFCIQALKSKGALSLQNFGMC
ncbi:ovomucoid-like [Podarcis lilfordi]|uniref:Ovomucoid-like n=1 Tax=Podarcis lilfordi TaxID=74358 RepID=A0AA35JY62_9SAUR|nr:ovomucoid-like [Podarcis lilfordi]